MRYTGTNPRVLTQPIQEFLFSLTHICRNIVDHGIEPAVTRLARGKDPAGQVSIHADSDRRRARTNGCISSSATTATASIPSRMRTKLATLDPQGAGGMKTTRP